MENVLMPTHIATQSQALVSAMKDFMLMRVAENVLLQEQQTV
jgi:hypothetical protein